jgi:hypothetical protein
LNAAIRVSELFHTVRTKVNEPLRNADQAFEAPILRDPERYEAAIAARVAITSPQLPFVHKTVMISRKSGARSSC